MPTEPRASSPTFLLRLLGAPRIEGPEGVLNGPAAQRHRLALLALLTNVPRGVLARDRIFGLLWPETDMASARRLLNNAVHVIRQTLGDGVVVNEGDGLRLDSAILRVDVLEFEAALKRGDALAAVELYTGPFLDGLSLPDAVEFEQWQERERERLERLHHVALERLAEATEREQGAAVALVWWRRRLACTPADGRVVLRLMRALADAGDRAGALQVAIAHSTLLREEFGAAPDAQVELLAERLRRESQPNGADAEHIPAIAHQQEQSDASNPHQSLGGEQRTAPAQSARKSRSPWWQKRTLIGTLAVVVVILAGGLTTLLHFRRVPLDPNLVVVAPFENQTGDTTLSVLGAVAVYRIVDALMGTQELGFVPTPAALSEWRNVQEQVSTGRVQDPIRALAEQTGAGIVISGSYQLEPNARLRLRAEITDAAKGRVIARADTSGSTSTPVGAIDALLRRIMTAAVFATPNMQQNRSGLVAMMSERPPTFEALQAFIDGMETGFMRRNWLGAQHHFLRAARLDTTFIAALLWAGFATVSLGDNARGDSLAEAAARRGAGRMSPLEKGMYQWVRSDARGDWNGAYLANLELSRIAPQSGFTTNVGYFAFFLGRPREGIKWMRQLERPRSGYSYWESFTWMYHVLGEHRKELRTALIGRGRNPPQLLEAELRAVAARGEHQRVFQLLEESLTLPNSNYLRHAEVAALELQAHGDSIRGMEVAQQAIAWHRARTDSTASRPVNVYAYARLLNIAGQHAEAYSVLDDLVRRNPDMGIKASLAFSAARLGKRAEAERLSQELAELDGTFLEGWHTYYRAQIAAGLGDKSAAIRLLRQAFQDHLQYNIELHRNLAFQWLRDDPDFRAILRPKG